MKSTCPLNIPKHATHDKVMYMALYKADGIIFSLEKCFLVVKVGRASSLTADFEPHDHSSITLGNMVIDLGSTVYPSHVKSKTPGAKGPMVLLTDPLNHGKGMGTELAKIVLESTHALGLAKDRPPTEIGPLPKLAKATGTDG